LDAWVVGSAAFCLMLQDPDMGKFRGLKIPRVKKWLMDPGATLNSEDRECSPVLTMLMPRSDTEARLRLLWLEDVAYR
jgi:hypothetical protein